MRQPHSTSGPGLVILSHDGSDELWNRIADAWPGWAEDPAVTSLSFKALLEERGRLRARVVLMDPGDDELAMFRSVDVLRDEGVPSVLLVDPPSLEKIGSACPGSIAMPRDASSTEIAASLHALMVRQGAFNSVQRELDVSRRFQGGLRGEMDKLHQELQLAASVQQELLPATMPVVEGAEFGVLFRPAGYVSGDIYDCNRLDEHIVGFFIADAVGHGVPAALMTMLIARGVQLKMLTHHGYELRTPGEALELLNRELVRRHAHAPRFATAMVGTLDTRTREITLAGAGHPPALIYGPDGRIKEIASEGGLLGVFEEDSFDDVTFTLEDDETLVLYTDGFETAFPQSLQTPGSEQLATREYETRFADLAAMHRVRGLTPALDALRLDLDTASGSLHQIDDITAMVIGPKPLAGSSSVASRSDQAA